MSHPPPYTVRMKNIMNDQKHEPRIAANSSSPNNFPSPRFSAFLRVSAVKVFLPTGSPHLTHLTSLTHLTLLPPVPSVSIRVHPWFPKLKFSPQNAQ
jgi:hypothetical protein